MEGSLEEKEVFEKTKFEIEVDDHISGFKIRRKNRNSCSLFPLN